MGGNDAAANRRPYRIGIEILVDIPRLSRRYPHSPSTAIESSTVTGGGLRNAPRILHLRIWAGWGRGGAPLIHRRYVLFGEKSLKGNPPSEGESLEDGAQNPTPSERWIFIEGVAGRPRLCGVFIGARVFFSKYRTARRRNLAPNLSKNEP